MIRIFYKNLFRSILTSIIVAIVTIIVTIIITGGGTYRRNDCDASKQAGHFRDNAACQRYHRQHSRGSRKLFMVQHRYGDGRMVFQRRKRLRQKTASRIFRRAYAAYNPRTYRRSKRIYDVYGIRQADFRDGSRDAERRIFKRLSSSFRTLPCGDRIAGYVLFRNADSL